MKKHLFASSRLQLICVASSILLVSCKKEATESFGKQETSSVAQTPEELGKTIFEGKGNCISCHKTDVKLVGPSLQDIAKIYKDNKASLVSFLKEENGPIVDPAQYEVMKANLVLTKAMSDEELKGLEAYIYKQLK